MMIAPGMTGGSIYNPPVASPTTWNPADKSASIGLSGGNLVASANGATIVGVRSTAFKTTGKWHWEVTMNLAQNKPDSLPGIGISDQASHNLTTRISNDVYSCAYQQSGLIRILNTTAATTTALADGDTVAVEMDLDNYRLYFQRYGDARLGPYDISALSGAAGFFACLGIIYTNDYCTANFGATTFLIPPTDGFAMGLG
jgi:hypothetical protein